MNGQNAAPSAPHLADSALYSYFHFGLIVTGKGERNHLPKLFTSLMATRICSFRVIRFVGQRSPITSPQRQLKMVGSGQSIPDRDAHEIGFPARRFLNANGGHFVVLVDDLEHDRKEQARQVFDRYRLAFDTVLNAQQKCRASVHLLVNMLEAYYFADAKAINAVLNLNLEDYPDDVETIYHPKNDLKDLYPGFDEIDDGGKILDQIDIDHVLSRPGTCAWLRTLFAWCAKALERCPDLEYYESLTLADKYYLRDGILSEVTRPQLDTL